MNNKYAKPYMSITELVDSTGLTRAYLNQLSRAKGAPIVRTMGQGKIFFITAELENFMKEITNRTHRMAYRR